jgi:hypothetical protein
MFFLCRGAAGCALNFSMECGGSTPLCSAATHGCASFTGNPRPPLAQVAILFQQQIGDEMMT